MSVMHSVRKQHAQPPPVLQHTHTHTHTHTRTHFFPQKVQHSALVRPEKGRQSMTTTLWLGIYGNLQAWSWQPLECDEAQASRVTHHFPFPQRGRILYPLLAANQFCHAERIGPKNAGKDVTYISQKQHRKTLTVLFAVPQKQHRKTLSVLFAKTHMNQNYTSCYYAQTIQH